MADAEIDTGDVVRHGPTGESWVVARVRDDKLAWCGWPQGWAELSDCVLVKKANAAARDKLLSDLAKSQGHHCAEWARDRLAAQEPTMADAQTPDPRFMGEAQEPVGYAVEALVDGKWRIQWPQTFNTEAEAHAGFGVYSAGARLRVAALYTHPVATPEPGNPASAGASGRAPTSEFEPCQSCFGAGVEGDSDDYGRTIDAAREKYPK